ncbi:hypothetical protein MA16_Dca005264 [Dendrobium catenatum]|uniref:Uncharacterized protein n=1 Tax=Dendrobium catenatum TaxID=906689 RepID=A0A2I0VDC9_9ASPA|nr:hypothetical protein MA16_Dca029004 [Dendrobium catenatum]PKU64341.1 hypothetical protein MA16_Dca005264 [Dendrobium catenatum]
MLGEYGFNDTSCNGMVKLTSLCKNSFCKHLLFFLGMSLNQSGIKWTEVFHPSHLL